MTVLVLGLDSLDVTRLRTRYDFPELELEENARIDLGGLSGVEVHTQVIWPVFLDGRHPHDSPTESSRMERLSRLARAVNIPEHIRRRVGSWLDAVDISDQVGRSVAFEESFLAKSRTAIPVSVPGLGEMQISDRVRTELSKLLSDDPDRSPETFWHLCEAEHEIKRAATETALNHSNVVMTHFYALDAVQHVAQNQNEERVETWYRRYADLVAELRQELDETDTLVVLSDHGMEDGVHGPEGKGEYAYAASTDPIGLSDGMSLSAVHDRLAQLVADTEDAMDGDTADPWDAMGDDVSEERRKHLEDLGYM